MSRESIPAAGSSTDAMREEPVGLPPILGTWRRMYFLVMAVFFAIVLLFAWLTQVYK